MIALGFRRVVILLALGLVAIVSLGSWAAADEARSDSPRLLDADGVWNALPQPGRSGHRVVLDPVNDRLILFGGTDPIVRGDLWWMPADGTSGWSALAVAAGPRPSAREQHSAIWDPVRNRMLVFGGDAPLSNQVWALTFSGMPTWQLLAPSGTPPSARSRHAAIYDPVRDRMLVFGGNDGGPLNDVWELTLSGSPAWTQLAPLGTPPAARYDHSAIYDPVRDRAVLYGGQADDDLVVLYDDAWALSLSGSPAWSPIVPSGSTPEARTMHRAAWDASHDGMVVFGGFTNGVAATTELEFTPVPSWITIPTPSELDIGITRHDVAVDASRHRMVLTGGEPSLDLIRRQHETWAFDLAGRSWNRLGPPVPARRYGHTLVYDPALRRMILYGGFGESDFTPDAWSLDLGGSQTWSDLATTGSHPPHAYHSAILAPTRHSMLVFGGDGPPGTSNVWELALAGTPAWAMLAVTGTPPPSRMFHSAVYDPARNRMIVYGGASGSTIFSDVWSLSLDATPTWTLLAPSGAAPARHGHCAIFDPIGDRMIVFGGRTSPSTTTNEVWQLSFSPTLAWTQLTPSGTPPSARDGAVSAYDPVRSRMLVFGSQFGMSDVWSLALSGPPAWTKLAPDGSVLLRWRSAAAFDDGGDRMVLFGGYRSTGIEGPYFLADTWALAFDDLAAVPEPSVAPRIGLASAFPNPARRAATFAFTLPAATRARLAIYDLEGRRVRTLRDGWHAAGKHTGVWDLASDDGARVPPGIYLCELASGGDRLSRKVVVSR